MVSDASKERQGAAAVLYSGGLDSAVLVADAARHGEVQPIYVAAGLAWEAQEHAAAVAFLDHLPARHRIRPLVALGVDMRDVYPASHWAIRGAAPAFDSPDEDVYLEGRNIVLLSKASVFCARAKIGTLLMGTLGGNPFPDASASFFTHIAGALSEGLAWPLSIRAPFATLHKSQVIVLGASLGVPLERTMSCMQPRGGKHCGTCSKCRERQDGFQEAGILDPTLYSTRVGG
jgi:7-cyano-7-deazaguanine synthase